MVKDGNIHFTCRKSRDSQASFYVCPCMITFCCLRVNYRLDKFNGTNDVRIKLKHHKLLPCEHFLRFKVYAGKSQNYRLSVKSGTPPEHPVIRPETSLIPKIGQQKKNGSLKYHN